MPSSSVFRSLVLACSSLVFVCGAHAATEVDTLSVSATVTNECSLTVGSGGLAFGTIDTNGGSSYQTDASVDLTLTCSTADAASASIAVGGGLNANAGQRRMISGANFASYDLYSDSGRTTTIAINGTLSPNLANTNPGGAVVTVYGRVPSGQNLAVGAYSDTVAITTTYEPGP